MDLPNPPQEQELKNIIDKLAQFVARNGLEFEQMTKTKQKDNPKFSFLFGGEFFNYYQYKVTTEQAILKHKQSREQNISEQPPQMMPIQGQPSSINPQSQIPSITQQSQISSIAPQSQIPSITPQMQIPSITPQSQIPSISSQNQIPSISSQNQIPSITPQSQIPSIAQYSAQNSQNYQNSYSYNYGPSSNYPADTSQYPPGVIANNYPPPQFNVHSITGDAPSMHIGSGIPTLSSTNFSSHSLPQNSYHSGDQSYMQGGSPAERQFPPSQSSFPPQSNMETSYGGPQQPSMMPPGTEHGNTNSSGYSLGPPRHMGANTQGSMPMGGSQTLPDVTNQSVITMQPPTESLEHILQEEQRLQEQIRQSEQNLSAQEQVLDQQRESQTQEGVYAARGELLQQNAEELGFSVQEFEDLLIPITESCTKDSISNGKQWIFTNAISSYSNEWISSYLLYKSTAISGPFSHKLHIIYLMNDVLHHCLRKNADNLKDYLEKSLSPMYCSAYTCASNDQRVKLEKLLSLWESKMHLDQSLLNELRNPEEGVTNFNNNLMNEFSEVVSSINRQLTTTFDGYKQQHNAFVQHANSQLQQLQQQKMQYEQSQQKQVPPPQHNFLPPMQTQQQFPAGGSQPPIPHEMDFNQPPPGFSSDGFPIVDFSKPPPGFMCEEKENVIPTVPYFELPAALMAPLIRISDNKFKPLDAGKLRLPLPTPPSERLLAAVENFYLLPSHDRPRNCDGWEQIALFDYYKAKTNSVKERERLANEGLRQMSRSPSPVVIEIVTDEDLYEHQLPLRRYRSVSPEEFDDEKEKEERPASPPSTRFSRRSESLSPVRNNKRSPVQRESRSPIQREPRSPIQRDARSPIQREIRSPSRSPSYSPPRCGRSVSRSPPNSGVSRSPPHSGFSRSPPQSGFSRARSRSLTPPSFGTSAPYSIEETNKGHQMLLGMGWSGAGLGLKEQGISTPISAAEVRDTPAERFRGLGIPSAQSDPFEAFRKNKGQAFINRMKQRAEEREKKQD